jgi:hypothetical protein
MLTNVECINHDHRRVFPSNVTGRADQTRPDPGIMSFSAAASQHNEMTLFDTLKARPAGAPVTKATS